MGLLREVDLGPSFPPFLAFQQSFGFIPNLFRAQTLLPRVIEVQAHIAAEVLVADRALSQTQKQLILLTVAAARQSVYCVTAHGKMLASLGIPESRLDQLLSDYQNADLSPADVALLDFTLRLAQSTPGVDASDMETLRGHGFDDEAILEAIQVTALTRFLCTLTIGLAPQPDFEPHPIPPRPPAPARTAPRMPRPAGKGPYLRAVYLSPVSFAPFAFLQRSFGFVPNIFRAQTLRPTVLEAEAHAVGQILLPGDVLTRVQKEAILLVISAACFNSYCVAVHCEMLRGLGIPPEESDQIAVDHHHANLSEADRALLDFALKLGVRPAGFGASDIDRLRGHGFTDQQILEAVVMTALTNFLNTLQVGLGTVPDFAPRLVFEPQKMHPSLPGTRPMDGSVLPVSPAAGEDPDAGLVSRAQGGALEAFEELIHRHSRHIYRILVAIIGDSEEAKDAMQDAFLSAFKHLDAFQGRSKFSTWLVSIARNAALERLRSRKPMESLDDDRFEGEEDFRPRQVGAWQDNPEQLYAEAEIRRLVEQGIMRLPAKYRVVLMLRDLEQLSTEQVAQELGLSIPALKARLLRGRLMLRELLAPHFTLSAGRAGA